MKTLALTCAVLAAGLVSSAKADDVSKSTLDAMGFGNATIMSDEDGLAIRGKGTRAEVWGNSTASYWDRTGAGSASNGYSAKSRSYRGSSLAKGGSDSYAGRVKESSKSYGRHTSTRSFSTLIISGGGAFAFAK